MTCLDRNSHCAKVCIFTIRICNFSNFVALCTDDKILQFPVINFLEIFGAYVLISRQSDLMFFCKNMTSTVDFSIRYGACFSESFSLSPNCAGIMRRSSWKLDWKFASCFRTRHSAFHIVRIVNIHTFTQ